VEDDQDMVEPLSIVVRDFGYDVTFSRTALDINNMTMQTTGSCWKKFLKRWSIQTKGSIL
jgi:hypothetical protein